MLAVQPVSINSYPKKVSFQRNDRQVFEEDREFYEQQKREIENLLGDEKIPKKMRKFLNVANIITDGLISGCAVGCATAATATCGKNTFNKLKGNKILKNAATGFKPMGEYASNGFAVLKHYAADFTRKIFGKENGQKIVDFAKKALDKINKFFNKINPFANVEKYDKATAKAATGLGVGAGVASAYAKAVEKSEAESGEA
jgi:hypothetical protein